MEKIIYRSDLEVALKKVEAELHEIYMSDGIWLHTALGTHLANALSAVSGSLSYVNQFEEK